VLRQVPAVRAMSLAKLRKIRSLRAYYRPRRSRQVGASTAGHGIEITSRRGFLAARIEKRRCDFFSAQSEKTICRLSRRYCDQRFLAHRGCPSFRKFIMMHRNFYTPVRLPRMLPKIFTACRWRIVDAELHRAASCTRSRVRVVTCAQRAREMIAVDANDARQHCCKAIVFLRRGAKDWINPPMSAAEGVGPWTNFSIVSSPRSA
jgi:hypothetical protein